jgi:aminoglycoside 3-N-acetyltransferase
MFKCDIVSLEESLRDLKIPKYSTIIIHSSLFKFGIIDGGVSTIYNTLKKVFDDTYTLLMPTYTFSFSNSREWNCITSKSETGVLTEYMRKLSPQNRSINPFHSVCIEGPQKEYLLKDFSDSSFGENSVYEKLYKLGAFNLSLGSEFVGGATFCHYAEELLKVPYRFYKSFPGVVTDSFSNKIDIDFKMYVRIIENDFYYDNNWEIFWDDALKNGLVNYFKFNKTAPIFLMNIKDSHDFLVERILKDPYYVATKILN